jgi:hypothetical protein
VPAPPAPPAPPASPAAAGASNPSPAIKITKAPGTEPDGVSKSIDIVIPGIVIDSKKQGTIHKGDVNITFGNDGIHVTSDEPAVDATATAAKAAKADVEAVRLEGEALQADKEAARIDASASAERDPDAREKLREKAQATREKAQESRGKAAEARSQAAEARAEARERAEQARQMAAEARERTREAVRRAVAEASSAAAAAASAAVAASPSGVDISAGGQTVHITVPPNADSADVKEAIEDARSAIVDALREAEDQRREQVQAAKEAADEAAAAARRSVQADGADSADTDSSDPGERRHVRTMTFRSGEMLMPLAMWWILGSLLLKITYKGRIQAEAKAAVATETAEAESLRRQVLEAKMAMMQAQVEPHFLFNTLASIDHLIEFDPKRASQMQRNLISLLRASMPSMRASESGLRPLDLELAVVRPYLEILKVRMEERLTTEIDVPEGLLSAEFPPMMIQTLAATWPSRRRSGTATCASPSRTPGSVSRAPPRARPTAPAWACRTSANGSRCSTARKPASRSPTIRQGARSSRSPCPTPPTPTKEKAHDGFP